MESEVRSVLAPLHIKEDLPCLMPHVDACTVCRDQDIENV